MIAFPSCMNITPLQAKPTSHPTPQRAATVRAAQRTSLLVKPSTHRKVVVGKKTAVVGKSLGRTRPATQKAVKRKVFKRVDCHGRMRYGKFCLGRVIGPRFSRQILRCPHCGKSVQVKRLEKPWKPANYDSDLRPYYGHFRQKDRIWVCRHCGYAAYRRDFFRPYHKRTMTDALRAVRRTFTSYKDIPASYRFLAANASYVARGRNAAFFAELFLRAMWSAREEKQAKSILSFRRAAILATRLSARRKLFPLSKQPIRFFQLADMLRQEGQWLESTYWLEQAYDALQEARKVKTKVKLGRFLERWILQIQQHISKKDKAVFLLDENLKRKQR